MQCWQCGRTVRQGAKLCIYCGAKLADDEEQEPRASGSRNGRRSSEQSEYRSPAPRGKEGSRGNAQLYDESDEYAAYNPPDDRDGHGARRERAAARPRDDGDYPDRSMNDPRPRESRPRDPMDDPRAPFQRGSGATPPSGRDRREPKRYDAEGEPPVKGNGNRRGARDYAVEERPRRASHPTRDDDRGGGGEPRLPHGSRREDRDEYAGFDNGRDNGRPASSSPSRRRSDMEHGSFDARGGRGDGYDDAHERGSSRDRRPVRSPQLERDWERGSFDARSGRGDARDARGMPYPQPALDDSWGMPAVGGSPLDDAWGVAPSEELPTPMGARGGRDARGRSGPGGRGGSSDKADKPKRGVVGRVFRILSMLITIIGLISSGILVAPKLLSHFGLTQGNTGDGQPPFATYTPGPTPTAPPQYARYVNQHIQFAIDYPKVWSVGEASADSGKTDNVVTFKRPTPQAVLIVEQSSGFDGISNDEMIHDETLAGQNDGSTFTEITTTPAHALIGGEQWLRRDFNVVTKAGTTLHMGILSCHHQGHGFVIVLVSLPQNFANDDQTTFQSILTTFRFLS